jgi:hypothetical protein
MAKLARVPLLLLLARKLRHALLMLKPSPSGPIGHRRRRCTTMNSAAAAVLTTGWLGLGFRAPFLPCWNHLAELVTLVTSASPAGEPPARPRHRSPLPCSAPYAGWDPHVGAPFPVLAQLGQRVGRFGRRQQPSGR